MNNISDLTIQFNSQTQYCIEEIDDESRLYSITYYQLGWGAFNFPYENFCVNVWLGRTEDTLLFDGADPEDNLSAWIRECKRSPYENDVYMEKIEFTQPTFSGSEDKYTNYTMNFKVGVPQGQEE